jgi:hypothetical protein
MVRGPGSLLFSLVHIVNVVQYMLNIKMLCLVAIYCGINNHTTNIFITKHQNCPYAENLCVVEPKLFVSTLP